MPPKKYRVPPPQPPRPSAIRIPPANRSRYSGALRDFIMQSAFRFMDDYDAEYKLDRKSITEYRQNIKKLKKEIENLETLDPKKAEQKALKEYESDLQKYDAAKRHSDFERDHHKEILKEIENWQPPSLNHRAFKDFLLEEIRYLITNSRPRVEVPVQKSGIDWVAENIQNREQQMRDLKESVSNNDRYVKNPDQWLDELASSFGE